MGPPIIFINLLKNASQLLEKLIQYSCNRINVLKLQIFIENLGVIYYHIVALKIGKLKKKYYG